MMDVSRYSRIFNEYPEDFQPDENQFLFIEQLKSVDVDANWNRLRDTIDDEYSTDPKEDSKFVFRFFFRYAAAVLLGIFVLSSTYYFISNVFQNEVLIGPLPIVKTINLPDNSVVILKNGGILRYSQKYNKRDRLVELTGDALFQITKNQELPFIVNSNRFFVKVTGTEFGVINSGNQFSCYLKSGRVIVGKSDARGLPMELIPGEMVKYTDASDSFIKTKVENEEDFPLMRDLLKYRNEPLSEVFSIFEFCYSKNFKTNNPEILDYKWTTDCENQELDSILHELSIVFDMQYSVLNDTIVFYKSP